MRSRSGIWKSSEISVVVNVPMSSASLMPGAVRLASATAATEMLSTSLSRRRIEAARSEPPTMATLRRPGRTRPPSASSIVSAISTPDPYSSRIPYR